jgi:large subunit ribosomal protein L23
MNLNEILIKPIITEKSTVVREKGVYVFKVSPRSNKIVIKQAVEKLFSVKVNKVRIVIQKPKVKTNLKTGKKNKKSSLKKAYVYIENKNKIMELDI